MNKPYKQSFICHFNDLSGISVQTVGFSQCEPLHRWGPGIKEFYLIHHIISGRGIFKINGEQHSLETGYTVLTYPDDIIDYWADKDDPWYYAWIGFSGIDIPRLLNMTEFAQKVRVINTPFPDDFHNHMIAATTCSGLEYYRYMEMNSHLSSIFAIMMKYASLPENRSGNSYVEKAVSFIENSYSSSSLSIQEIADSIGITTTYLYRLFMKEFHVPPNQYLTNRRIRQACKLWQHDTSLPVHIIATSVGYADPFYFSKVFKKITGISPSDYIKTL